MPSLCYDLRESFESAAVEHATGAPALCCTPSSSLYPALPAYTNPTHPSSSFSGELGGQGGEHAQGAYKDRRKAGIAIVPVATPTVSLTTHVQVHSPARARMQRE